MAQPDFADTDPAGEPWDGAERRAHLQHWERGTEPTMREVMESLHALRSGQAAQRKHQRAIDHELRQHIAREELQVAAAFVDGDPNAHRRAHEVMIAAAEAEQKFWADLRKDLAQKGLWAIILVVAGLAVAGAISRINGGATP